MVADQHQAGGSASSSHPQSSPGEDHDAFSSAPVPSYEFALLRAPLELLREQIKTQLKSSDRNLGHIQSYLEQEKVAKGISTAAEARTRLGKIIAKLKGLKQSHAENRAADGELLEALIERSRNAAAASSTALVSSSTDSLLALYLGDRGLTTTAASLLASSDASKGRKNLKPGTSSSMIAELELLAEQERILADMRDKGDYRSAIEWCRTCPGAAGMAPVRNLLAALYVEHFLQTVFGRMTRGTSAPAGAEPEAGRSTAAAALEVNAKVISETTAPRCATETGGAKMIAPNAGGAPEQGIVIDSAPAARPIEGGGKQDNLRSEVNLDSFDDLDILMSAAEAGVSRLQELSGFVFGPGSVGAPRESGPGAAVGGATSSAAQDQAIQQRQRRSTTTTATRGPSELTEDTQHHHEQVAAASASANRGSRRTAMLPSGAEAAAPTAGPATGSAVAPGVPSGSAVVAGTTAAANSAAHVDVSNLLSTKKYVGHRLQKEALSLLLFILREAAPFFDDDGVSHADAVVGAGIASSSSAAAADAEFDGATIGVSQGQGPPAAGAAVAANATDSSSTPRTAAATLDEAASARTFGGPPSAASNLNVPSPVIVRGLSGRRVAQSPSADHMEDAPGGAIAGEQDEAATEQPHEPPSTSREQPLPPRPAPRRVLRAGQLFSIRRPGAGGAGSSASNRAPPTSSHERRNEQLQEVVVEEAPAPSSRLLGARGAATGVVLGPRNVSSRGGSGFPGTSAYANVVNTMTNAASSLPRVVAAPASYADVVRTAGSAAAAASYQAPYNISNALEPEERAGGSRSADGLNSNHDFLQLDPISSGSSSSDLLDHAAACEGTANAIKVPERYRYLLEKERKHELQQMFRLVFRHVHGLAVKKHLFESLMETGFFALANANGSVGGCGNAAAPARVLGGSGGGGTPRPIPGPPGARGERGALQSFAPMPPSSGQFHAGVGGGRGSSRAGSGSSFNSSLLQTSTTSTYRQGQIAARAAADQATLRAPPQEDHYMMHVTSTGGGAGQPRQADDEVSRMRAPPLVGGPVTAAAFAPAGLSLSSQLSSVDRLLPNPGGSEENANATIAAAPAETMLRADDALLQLASQYISGRGGGSPPFGSALAGGPSGSPSSTSFLPSVLPPLNVFLPRDNADQHLVQHNRQMIRQALYPVASSGGISTSSGAGAAAPGGSFAGAGAGGATGGPPFFSRSAAGSSVRGSGEGTRTGDPVDSVPASAGRGAGVPMDVELETESFAFAGERALSSSAGTMTFGLDEPGSTSRRVVPSGSGAPSPADGAASAAGERDATLASSSVKIPLTTSSCPTDDLHLRVFLDAKIPKCTRSESVLLDPKTGKLLERNDDLYADDDGVLHVVRRSAVVNNTAGSGQENSFAGPHGGTYRKVFVT